jgi:uncharacterized membrane protein
MSTVAHESSILVIVEVWRARQVVVPFLHTFELNIAIVVFIVGMGTILFLVVFDLSGSEGES